MTAATPVWAERAVDRSPAVRRYRARQLAQATAVVDAARRLLAERGDRFTTQELAKEAGIGLQTFYRLFASKDQLLLTVFEDMVTEHCVAIEAAVAELPDPVARLRFVITATALASDGSFNAQIMTAEYWRLHELFPDEMAGVTRQFNALVTRQLELARERGVAMRAEGPLDAWFVTKLVIAVFHDLAFAGVGSEPQMVADELWAFCRGAFGIADDG